MMSRAGWNRVFPRRMLAISAQKISPKTAAAQNIPEIRIMENEIFSEQPFSPIISKVIRKVVVDFKNSKTGFQSFNSQRLRDQQRELAALQYFSKAMDAVFLQARG